jgi:hypothetical protein
VALRTSLHKLLLIAAGCRALLTSGCPLLSCLRSVAMLKDDLTVPFFGRNLHFLENHLTTILIAQLAQDEECRRTGS